MKTELTDVSDTRKTLTIEIPRKEIDAEIDRVARNYSKDVRIPGFRKGKVPTSIVKQRFRDKILHDVTHTLIPRAVQDALQERGIEPIDSPNIEDVSLVEGQPLTFTAAVDTVPSIEPGDLSAISLRRTRPTTTDDAVDQALEQLRERAAKFEPVEGRSAVDGDTVVMDLNRRNPGEEEERHEDTSIQLGAAENPPGFDKHIVGMNPGESRTFEVAFPEDHTVAELSGTTMNYTALVKEIRRRVLPELDDEFARDLGEFDSLATLRNRVRADLEAQAALATERQVRDDLLKQLSKRVTFDPPESLIEHELDRRLRDLVERMIAQNVDPRQAGIDWDKFREEQRDTALQAVKSALVLDEIARRENLHVTAEDVDKEIERFAARAERTPDAIRAQLEKEDRILSLHNGLRREKAVELALGRAKITNE
jgi:trigger factor